MKTRTRAPRLSLDLLRGFRAAARTLSFTQAARECFVTQSAISREVKTLEAQLGQPLFRRINRSLQLTHAGEELRRATEQALDVIDVAAARIAASGGLLGVTTTTALASTWLVPRLPRFTRRHPHVDVRVVASNDDIDLDREHLDVAIHFVVAGSPPSGGELLMPYEVFPVCAPALARDRRRPLRTPADLARHVRLDFEAVVYGRSWYDWDRWASVLDLDIRPASTLRFSHYDQVIHAAIEGAGVAIGKRPHLEQHLRDGRLVAPLGPRYVAPLGQFDLVLAPRAADNPDVAAFVAWLKEEVRRDARPLRAPAREVDVAAAAEKRRGRVSRASAGSASARSPRPPR